MNLTLDVKPFAPCPLQGLFRFHTKRRKGSMQAARVGDGEASTASLSASYNCWIEQSV